MRHNKKAFTLIEMLVAMSVSAIIVAATYASFELIQKQYKKNVDIVELHTSGRAIMQVIEREIRMAGYEFRDVNGLMTYGSILSPIVIIDSGDKCCDEVTIIYDEVADFLNSSGVVTSSTVDRIQIRFWTEAHSSSNKGSRFRLYKRRTVLGTNNALLATPNIGPKEVMADFIEDIQFDNTSGFANLYASDYEKLHIYDTISKKYVRTISLPFTPYSTGSISIDRNGSVYIPVGKNGRTSILIINPKSGYMNFLFDGSNFRGYGLESELIAKAYANNFAAAITNQVYLEENEDYLLNHNDLIKTDSYSKNFLQIPSNWLSSMNEFKNSSLNKKVHSKTFLNHPYLHYDRQLTELLTQRAVP